jgi:hypothetical protein
MDDLYEKLNIIVCILYINLWINIYDVDKEIKQEFNEYS